MKSEVEQLLKSHRQLHDWTCASSAYEFIAKLHGKIAADIFPLQNDLDADKGGFQFDPFLNNIGFKSTECHKVPMDALDVLKQETMEGRYPLVAIVAAVTPQGSLWHIMVAIQDEGEVVLLDPATQKQHTKSSRETLEALKHTVSSVANRPEIHFLTYSTCVRDS